MECYLVFIIYLIFIVSAFYNNFILSFLSNDSVFLLLPVVLWTVHIT